MRLIVRPLLVFCAMWVGVCLARAQPRSVDDPLDTASALHSQGAMFAERGEFATAVSLHRQALAIRLKHLRPDDIALADSFDQLGLALTRMERWREARQMLVRALVLREPRAAIDKSGLAHTLELIGWMDRYAGNFQEARAVLNRVLELRRDLPADHPDRASATELLGDLRWLHGEIENARNTWRDGLAAVEGSLGSQHPMRLAFLWRLALALDALGERAEAHAIYDRAAPIAEQLQAPCHPDVLALQAYRASSEDYDGRYSEARKLHQRTLKALETCLGPQHSRTATVIYNLGVLAANMGDFAEAERLHTRALRIWSTGLGAKHPFVARAMDALAEVAEARGQRAHARELYQRVLVLRRASLGTEHPDVAWTLTNLARVNLDAGDLAIAERHAEQAIEIYRRNGASDEPDHFARVLALRGDIESRRGKNDAARASFEEALAIRERIFGGTHPLAAETRGQLAGARFALGAYGDALDIALDAEQAGRDHLRFTVRYLPERQAMAYAAKRARALDLTLSIAALDRPSAAALDRPAAAASDARASSQHDVRANSERDVRAGSEHDAALARIFDAVIRSRGVILDELAARAVAVDTSDPTAAPVLAAAAKARQRYADLVVRSLREDVARSLLDEAREQKEEAERTLAERSIAAYAELSRARTGLDDVRGALPADAALVSFVKYDRTRATAQWARPVSSYGAFVQRADSDRAQSDRTGTDRAAADRTATASLVFVPLGSADSIDALIEQWRDEAAGRSRAMSTSAIVAERAYRTIADQLRRVVWDPLTPHLAGAARIFIVPDGLLNIVNIAALPERAASAVAGPGTGTAAGLRYIAEDATVLHYLSTERDLMTSSANVVAAGRSLLAVGGASFDLGRVPAMSKVTSKAAPIAARASSTGMIALNAGLRRSGCENFNTIRFKDLPGSRREVDEISQIWPAHDPTDLKVLRGLDATETAVKEALTGRRVVHLATHGFFLNGGSCASEAETTAQTATQTTKRTATGTATRTATRVTPDDARGVGGLVSASRPHRNAVAENPLQLSGLALAGANRRGARGSSPDDGILTAEEIASLDLRGTEWAVLSACDTGLGEIATGEGVFGLRRAFQIAGARTVIMSLWSVQDDAAHRWMRALYDGRWTQGLTTADAVHRASLTVLEERRAHKQSTHPFYWAGFVAVGDWH
jgi:CHAT domain-containing protein